MGAKGSTVLYLPLTITLVSSWEFGRSLFYLRPFYLDAPRVAGCKSYENNAGLTGPGSTNLTIDSLTSMLRQKASKAEKELR